jgi:dolichol-phosphate mannosyltransferase
VSVAPAGPSPSDLGGAAPSTVHTSIVLATLNERSNLPEVLDRIRRQDLPAIEILVVDDGSVDGTREYVLGLSLADPRVRLLPHDGKQTTLRAQCQGIEAARGERIVVMDADLQHPPELLPKLLGALDSGAALAIASRYAAGGSAGPRTVYRWTMSHGAEWLTRLLLPSARGVRDPVSGFFAFRREIWRPLNPQYRGYKLGIFLLVMS